MYYIIKYEPVGKKECYNIYYYENNEEVSSEYYGASLDNPVSAIRLGYLKHKDSL